MAGNACAPLPCFPPTTCNDSEGIYTVSVENDTVMLRMRAFRLISLYADEFAGPTGWWYGSSGADGRVEAFAITVERLRGLRFDRVR